MCLHGSYIDLLNWQVGHLVYYAGCIFVPAQIFPDRKYILFEFLGPSRYLDTTWGHSWIHNLCRIHKGAYVDTLPMSYCSNNWITAIYSSLVTAFFSMIFFFFPIRASFVLQRHYHATTIAWSSSFCCNWLLTGWFFCQLIQYQCLCENSNPLQQSRINHKQGNSSITIELGQSNLATNRLFCKTHDDGGVW